MDDKKVYELKRLELAYKKQIVFISGTILLTLIGVTLYIFNIYRYNFQLLLVSIVLVVVGLIGMFNIDQHMKDISQKIKEL